MKVRITAAVVSFMLLTACADSSSQEPSSSLAPETLSSVEITTTTVTTTEAVPSTTSAQVKSAKKIIIDADIISYEDSKLTFAYDGQEYTLPMDRALFNDGTILIGHVVNTMPPNPYYKSLPEKIIENRFSEEVKAKLTVDEDITVIKYCNIIDPNGKLFTGFGTTQGGSFKFRRTGGSLCEFYNDKETIEADLNDLPNYIKLKFPESIDDIYFFEGYLFKDGKFILNYLDTASSGNESAYGLLTRYNKATSFFGTVQSVSDGKATFILNDGKTVCTAPTYFNDGEVTEGAQVMVTLDEDTSLYGSGESKEYDFAVFYTSPDTYDFENKMYALDDSGKLGGFTVKYKWQL